MKFNERFNFNPVNCTVLLLLFDKVNKKIIFRNIIYTQRENKTRYLLLLLLLLKLYRKKDERVREREIVFNYGVRYQIYLLFEFDSTTGGARTISIILLDFFYFPLSISYLVCD